jgi:hypothetical protein
MRAARQLRMPGVARDDPDPVEQKPVEIVLIHALYAAQHGRRNNPAHRMGVLFFVGIDRVWRRLEDQADIQAALATPPAASAAQPAQNL